MRAQPRFRTGLALLGLALVGQIGCAENQMHDSKSESREIAYKPAAAARAIPNALLGTVPAESPQTPARAGADSKVTSPPQATANRKIIYNTTIDLITKNLNQLEASLTSLIQAQGAYVADSDRSGAAGSTRRGHWKVRVPVESYDAFVRGAIGLGELVSTQAQSQDVSAEYYDLDARTAAKKVEEARLLKHLADSTGRLDEILTVERELTRVRSEIEQMQGRLAVLGNLTALATVTITAAEIQQVAQPPALDPTFRQRVAATFHDSLANLQAIGETLALVVVAVVPWLPILIPASFLILWAVRRANAYVAATGAVGAPPRAG